MHFASRLFVVIISVHLFAKFAFELVMMPLFAVKMPSVLLMAAMCNVQIVRLRLCCNPLSKNLYVPEIIEFFHIWHLRDD